MSRKKKLPILRYLAIILVLVLIIAGGATAYRSVAAGRITGQQTVVMAPEIVRPGAETAMRAFVQDFNTGKPIRNASVTMSLLPDEGGKAVTLYRGKTDKAGSALATVAIPDDLEGSGTLIIETKSAAGTSTLRRAIEVRRDAKLFLTTDKPLYQPGQTIHIRCLALNVGDLSPAAGEELVYVVEDPKGNKVHRSTAALSDWGIGSLDFTLASEVNQGSYKIVATLGETTSEKTVTVKPYVLPKFGIDVETERAYYRPGERVEGTLKATYFFGKPVNEAEVEIVGYQREIERLEVLNLRGTTDDQGGFEFSFDLPDYFVGSMVEQGLATFALEITVIDQAEHAEFNGHALTISEQPIVIDAVPESGDLKPGIENLVYVMTTYPDGSPAQTELVINDFGEETVLTTGEFGLATLSFTPDIAGPFKLAIQARDAQGNQAGRIIQLPTERADEYVLLRPERAAYRVGDTMRVDVLASASQGTAYLDIIRDGQTLSTRTIDIVDGLATAQVDLDEGLYGTLQLHAYKVLRDAITIRDTRLVIVDRAMNIDLNITADRDTYRPGETAKLLFETTHEGQPLPAALGLSIVDESVFALQEQEAGFAKLYFLLQAEMLKPRYQLKWFQPGELVAPPTTQGTERPEQETAAKAVLATMPGEGPMAMAESRQDKTRSIQTEKRIIHQGTLDGLTSTVVAVSALGFIICLGALIQRKAIGNALGAGIVILIVAVVTVFVAQVVALSALGRWGNLDILGALGMLLFLVAMVSIVIYGIDAWRNKDRPLLAAYLALLVCLLILPMISYAAGSATNSRTWALRPLAAMGLIVFGIYFHGMGLTTAGERQRGLTGVVAGVALISTLAFGGSSAILGSNITSISTNISGTLSGDGGGGIRPGVVFEELSGSPLMQRRAAAPAVVEKEMRVEEMMLDLEGFKPAGEDNSSGAQEAPRLRQFFPETMYWNPQVLTDETGRAELEIPVADSITTWRMSALASSQSGQLGSATAGLRVFQDFFIDLDLPLYLTQNDLVSLPVAVFNYLPEPQEVRLVVQEASWFELLDDQEKTMTIAANDIDVVYFRIRAAEFGNNSFQVTAWGSRMSDAIVKSVRVMPDGKAIRSARNEKLSESVSTPVMIPENAIPGTPKIWVKLYPGVVSQIVEGLSGMLKMPFG
jgi:hypothetical protein